MGQENVASFLEHAGRARARTPIPIAMDNTRGIRMVHLLGRHYREEKRDRLLQMRPREAFRTHPTRPTGSSILYQVSPGLPTDSRILTLSPPEGAASERAELSGP